MVTNKKVLVYALGFFGTLGAIALSYVFFSSLKPNQKSLSELPSISLTGLPPGNFMYAPHPVRYSSSTYGMNILFIRGRDSRLFAYYVRTLDGVNTVPIERHRWSDLKCAKFQPNFHTSEIACIDNLPMSDYATKHRWSLEGKNLSHNGEDLEPVRGVEEYDRFVLYKPAHG